MITLLIAIFFLLVLLKSANVFVDQAVAIAKKFKLSPFIIGFTIIALGTSLPELVASTYSTYTGHTHLAVSNVIGSNLANLCLILGLLPFVKTFKLSNKDVHFNIPLTLAATGSFLFVLYLNNFVISAFLGGMMIITFFFLMLFVNTENHAKGIKTTTKLNYWIFSLSLVLLIVSGKLLVDNLIAFSISSGLEESILGFFITAIGTSLPELVTAYVAISKGNAELGVGNILGSNLFNTFFILGVSALITNIDIKYFEFDLILLVAATLFVAISGFIGRKYFFSKREGFMIFLVYIVFVIYQII